MRRALCVILTVGLLVYGVTVYLGSAAAQGGLPLVPGVSLADIPLGAPIAEVVQRFGAPSQVQLVGSDGTLAYSWDRYGITVYSRGKAVIAVATTNSLAGAFQGIGIGTSADAVLKMLGKPRTGGQVAGYQGIAYDSLGIAFGLDRQAVVAVMVFVPQRPQAAPATPQAPAPETAPAAPATPQPAQPAPAAPAPAPEQPARPAPAAPAPALPQQPAPAQPAPVVMGEAAAPPAPAPAVAPDAQATSPRPQRIVVDALSLTPRPLAQESTGTAPRPGVVRADVPAAGAAGMPNVAGLRPFSIETLYLSQAGYLRYMVYQIQQVWLNPAESERIIRQATTAPQP